MLVSHNGEAIFVNGSSTRMELPVILTPGAGSEVHFRFRRFSSSGVCDVQQFVARPCLHDVIEAWRRMQALPQVKDLNFVCITPGGAVILRDQVALSTVLEKITGTVDIIVSDPQEEKILRIDESLRPQGFELTASEFERKANETQHAEALWIGSPVDYARLCANTPTFVKHIHYDRQLIMGGTVIVPTDIAEQELNLATSDEPIRGIGQWLVDNYELQAEEAKMIEDVTATKAQEIWSNALRLLGKVAPVRVLKSHFILTTDS